MVHHSDLVGWERNQDDINSIDMIYLNKLGKPKCEFYPPSYNVNSPRNKI